MSDQYVGEIRMFGGNYAPDGWVLCDGSLLSIANYQALYALIGTTYGGDGQTTFAVPDLRGRVPIHFSSTHPLAQSGGSEQVTLVMNQLPTHTHTPMADNQSGTGGSPAGAIWAANEGYTPFMPPGATTVNMGAGAISAAGGSAPHDNMMPFLVVSFIIAYDGIWPSPS